MKKGKFAFLRTLVISMQKATASGTKDFELFARLHGSEIYTCKYNEIGHIYCDTMSVKDGVMVMTEQNLQYYPAKIRYFILS